MRAGNSGFPRMTTMQSVLRFLGRGLICGLLVALVAGCGPKLPLPVLGPAPAWSVTTLDGKVLGPEQLKGKVVVVDFWATWCAPCVQEVPGYVELQKKYADRGLVIVGLSTDAQGEEVVGPFAKRMNVNYPLALASPEVIAAFGDIEGLPTTFLIDREGKIRHRKLGAMETAEYEELIKPLL